MFVLSFYPDVRMLLNFHEYLIFLFCWMRLLNREQAFQELCERFTQPAKVSQIEQLFVLLLGTLITLINTNQHHKQSVTSTDREI